MRYKLNFTMDFFLTLENKFTMDFFLTVENKKEADKQGEIIKKTLNWVSPGIKYNGATLLPYDIEKAVMDDIINKDIEYR